MVQARMSRWVIAGVVAGLLAAAPVAAQSTDPADLAFWQTVQNSSDPAEYEAYLQAFPHGTFATLARARMVRLMAGGAGPAAPAAPAAAPGAAPAPEAEPQDEVAEKLTVSPQPGRVGDMVKITCENLPNPFYEDMILV